MEGAHTNAYSPSGHRERNRSSSMSYSDQYRANPGSPTNGRMPLPSPSARDRPVSGYYDPTRASTHDVASASAPYPPKSPSVVRRAFDPVHATHNSASPYANGRTADQSAVMPGPLGQASPAASSTAAGVAPVVPHSMTSPDLRTSPTAFDPVRNGIHSHTSSTEVATPAQPPPQRSSNPMAMTNLLSNAAAPEPTQASQPVVSTPVAPSLPPPVAASSLPTKSPVVTTATSRQQKAQPESAEPTVTPKPPKAARKRASAKGSEKSRHKETWEKPNADFSRKQSDDVRRPPPAAVSRPPNLTVRDTEAAYAEIEAQDLSDVEGDFEGRERMLHDWNVRGLKRLFEIEVAEDNKRKRRRTRLMEKYYEALTTAADAERSMFLDQHEQEVAEEVRLKEIEEDKERKKDQQRKRRREKAIADEQVKKEEALVQLANAEDDEERARIQKEIQRYEKKIRDTQNRLQGIQPTKEPRHESPQTTAALGRREREVPVDGGLMTSFYSHNGAPGEEGTPEATPNARGGKAGRGGRGGARARKSKEQKQAEKDNAARAQAFIDQGQDLPALAPKEEERLQQLAERRARDDSEAPSDGTPAAPESQPAPGITGMAKFESKGYNQIYEQITRDIAKAIPKLARVKNNSLDTKQSNARKTAQLAAKEARRWQLRTNKSTKDVAARAKRAMREMLGFWKRNERDEREGRKVAEKQELERARRAEAEREANRQKRKLNFLISQTELYSHFIGKKVKTDEIERHGSGEDGVTPSGQLLRDHPNATHRVDLPDSVGNLNAKVTDFDQLDFDAEDETALQQAAMANAQHAIQEAQDRAKAFDRQANQNGGELSGAQNDFDEGEMNFQNPTSLQSMDVTQPKMLSCTLKEYQIKGLNWLVNLYEQGINGILADEMGLGKTVQSISVMAYLAEVHNIWGPFLVIAPASTLHNWQQEITKFVPDIKTLPYWGSAKDRKILRKYWDRKHITYSRDSAFHVLVTSYQLVVQDAAYFQKVKWQYMILDEAQAIKSSQSSRWKSLLGFHCRNRLLLTGTPIQNNMQELWALLHFIMPSLFDSHDEFSEWFSKDIENHAQSNTKLNEDQLRRLHMILKPFMLRRIKKHVQKELGDKIEKDVFCDLTYRQRAYYTNLRNKISILDLIEKAAVGDDQDTATLMNLVMQFRKVCNHPDLFERAEVWSPMSMAHYAETASFMREGAKVDVAYSVRSMIEFWLPKMLGEDQGRLDAVGPTNPRAGWLKRSFKSDLSIWDERNICASERQNGAFSWLRFVDQSATDVVNAARQSLLDRVLDLARQQRDTGDKLGLLKVAYDDGHEEEKENAGFSPVHAMLNIVERNNRRPLSNVTKHGRLSRLMNVARDRLAEHGYSVLEACYLPRASAPPVELVCTSHRSMAEQETALFSAPLRSALNPISVTTEAALIEANLPRSKYPITNLLPAAEAQKQRFTNIQVPSMRRFVTDSGKLACLDRLLRELKEGGHRVLLYFQMTRMIDLMEEYLTYRNYKYCRLDGSTKLEDRRDTVAAFQSSPEIFVFLLSTRAGGLGINLTSADTVIFYDSDWNPTIDSQAMDRAHRLGQTRQVTVYRLITRGTIEERIRKRALQKEEVQRVVISGQAGGDRVVDFNQRSHREGNRTKEMAMWLADDDQAAAIERREAELVEEEARNGGKGKKRKAPTAGKRKEMSMDDMYHEGEGNFADASHEPSGAATPVSAIDGPPLKKKKGLSKKAKTVKQRLAVVDGEVG